ncbi:TRANSIENT RECEPTOR POTENTIAL ION CHANNEL PROTEIN [Ceraceosorus bombacis]|uniref:TRANSIENT RECEPTOR POTENTIAL ION CHANNEL PROTEIN n=1 Tax=Ceraceosorus bombacis TaxID=401625 RepID=A0A0P1B8Q2_9BASI|nr:TRANSIENT RECEPTOR POTENTIAL ION CHANNEL PROTEIN [Ceraceosorus bombacis]
MDWLGNSIHHLGLWICARRSSPASSASFCIVAFSWLGLRISGLVHSDALRCDLSFDCLAVGAILLCPRVASSLVQDNVILLALKAMFADFAFFMLLASICFSGFLYAFWSLSDKSEWTVGSIMWLMLKIWFGSSYIGFDTATDFSPIFGPPLMVFFAIMANTLLLTVLISLLSNTFTVVATNAAEEAMFQHACKTMLGVTTDALFSYIPPLNLIGVLVVLPASYVLTPRWLHKLNVALIRATHWPMLLLIRATQKRGLREGVELTASRASRAFSWMPLPRSGKSDMDIVDAVFCRPPPEDQGGTRDSLPTRHRNADMSFRERAKSGGPSSASLPSDPEGCSQGAERQAGYGAVETSGKQTTVPLHVDKASGTTRPSSREQETQTKDGKRSSSPSAASRALGNAQGGTFASASSRPDHSDPSPAFSLSSPLARIFSGGGGGRRGGRNAAVSPLRQARPDNDAAADARHFTDEDGDGEGASTRDLFVALSERLDQQEKRSRRIEELLVSAKADRAEEEAQQASSSG